MAVLHGTYMYSTDVTYAT